MLFNPGITIHHHQVARQRLLGKEQRFYGAEQRSKLLCGRTALPSPGNVPECASKNFCARERIAGMEKMLVKINNKT